MSCCSICVGCACDALAVIASMYSVVGAMGDDAGARSVVASSVLAIKTSVLIVVSSMWADTASMRPFTSFKHDVQPLRRLLNKPKSPDSTAVQAFQVEAK